MLFRRLFSFGLIVVVALLPWQARLFIREASIEGLYWEYGTISIYIIDIFILFLFVLAVIIWRKNVFTVKDGIPLTIIIWVAWLALQQIFFGLSYTFHIIGPVISFLVFIANKRTPIRLFHIAFAIGIGAFVTSLFGIWQFIHQEVVSSTLLGIATQTPDTLGVSVIEFTKGRFLRSYGTLSHPNVLGGWLVVGIVSFWYVYQERTSLIWRTALLFMTIIITFALLLTFSRSAFFALLFVIMLWIIIIFFMRSIRKSIIVVTILTVLLGSFLLSDILFGRFIEPSRLDQQSVSERLHEYSEWQSLISGYWIGGIGIQNYSRALAVKDHFSKPAWAYQPIHNAYVLLLVETGIIGFIIFFLLFFLLIRRLFASLHQHPVVTFYGMTLLIIPLFISFFDHYWFSSHFGTVALWLLLAINIGIIYQKQYPRTI